jgi:hypothetical protein
MTTEAEEFKKQELRFEALVEKFCKIWWPHITKVRYVLGAPDLRFRHRAFLQVGNEVMLNSGPYYFSHISRSLCALNNRLELALQGKTKNE